MEPVFFNTPAEFRQWLEENHDKKTEIWVGFWKKISGKTGVNYDQALDEALCYGWIDGIARTYNEQSYMQRFTPRRSKSVWSKINTQHIARLLKEGKMMPAGLAVVEAAKADGRWEDAYESPKDMEVPADFITELKKDKKAYEFYLTLSRANTYAIAWRLQTAKKPETRAKRMDALLKMLAEGKKLH